MFSGPILFKYVLLHRIGRIKTACAGFIISSAGLLIFGLAHYLQSNGAFLTLSILGRCFEGLGGNLTVPAIELMISTYFPDDYNSYFVAYNLGMSLADAMGPLWGGLLFHSLGYGGIFFI